MKPFIHTLYKKYSWTVINILNEGIYFAFKCDRILPKTRNTYRRITLPIVRPSFDETLETDFAHQGIIFSAKIKDPDFQKSIHSGRCFAKGDFLKVELVITQNWDKNHRLYINQSYEVIRVLEHTSKNSYLI